MGYSKSIGGGIPSSPQPLTLSAMTLQARLRSNRQTQASISELIVKNNEDRALRNVLIEKLLEVVAEAAEIERQLLAA
jgi:hypothetical protein